MLKLKKTALAFFLILSCKTTEEIAFQSEESTDSDKEERADELAFNKAAEVLRDAELLQFQLEKESSAHPLINESDSEGETEGYGNSYGQAWNSFGNNLKFVSRGMSPTIRPCRTSEVPRRGVRAKAYGKGKSGKLEIPDAAGDDHVMLSGDLDDLPTSDVECEGMLEDQCATTLPGLAAGCVSASEFYGDIEPEGRLEETSVIP